MDAWRKPDPVLQHLRRVLLLRMLDAGRAAEAGVRVSGQLGLMPESIDGLPPELGLTSHWTSEWARAFARTHDRRDGRDIRERLQAGRMLGALGDTLRYELAPAAGGEGLRLKSELWATVGTPVSATAFGIGSPFGERGTWPDEQPLWSTAVPKSPTTVLQVARLPVTRAEWHRFVQAGGYDLNAPHWKGVRPAADDWLRCGSVSQAAAFSEVDRRLDLDPMTGITLFEALAYAAWSAPMYEIDNPDRAKLRLRLRLPTEVEWEASQRARPDGRPVSGRAHRLHAFGQNGPQRMDLNHVRTGWGQPSPVGVFSKANSPGGLADGLGNVWEWCVNSLPGGPRPYDVDGSRHEAQADWDPNDASSPRALRGGSYHSLIEECRPASRYQARPNDASSDVGMRLIRLWQPLETLPNRKSE
jgi:formylglycine-generating enzyme required for sulfatase activity